MSDLTQMWDELRRAGYDALAAVTAISSATGLDRETVQRQLARSLAADKRNPDTELLEPLRRLKRQRKPTRGGHSRVTVQPVPARPRRPQMPRGEAA